MKEKRIYPIYFTFGAIILFILLYFIPSVMGMIYSFTDWSRYSEEVKFIGLHNFAIMFEHKSNYLLFIKNTLIFTVVSTTLKTVLALALAILFTSKMVKAVNFHRMIAFSPQVLSTLIVGLVFKSILHPSNGFLNHFLLAVGLGALRHDWLGEVDTAFKSIIGVDAWKGVGYGMVIFIAGIQAISSDYFEAAKIDGANFWQIVKHIMVPCLTQTIVVNVVLSISYGLRVFDIVYVVTNGGPGYATDVINTAVFSEFSKGNYAMGSAMSTLLAAFTVFISFFIIKNFSKSGGNS